MDKYIKLDDAVKAINKEWSGCSFDGSGDSISDRCEDVLMEVPSIQIKFAKWVPGIGAKRFLPRLLRAGGGITIST